MEGYSSGYQLYIQQNETNVYIYQNSGGKAQKSKEFFLRLQKTCNKTGGTLSWNGKVLPHHQQVTNPQFINKEWDSQKTGTHLDQETCGSETKVFICLFFFLIESRGPLLLDGDVGWALLLSHHPVEVVIAGWLAIKSPAGA